MAEPTMQELKTMLMHCLQLAKPKAGSPPELITAYATSIRAVLDVIRKIEAEQ